MLNLFTIVLDGMPWITCHLPVFNQLKIDWHWTIAEGVAMPVKDTAWCKPIAPRLSWDGTTQYLDSIRNHPRVTVIQRAQWNGKTEQCNACLAAMPQSPGVLMQVDSDELWTAGDLQRVNNRLGSPHHLEHLRAMQFRCRYFVGNNLVITSDNTYGNRNGEWMRAWKHFPGQFFVKHEPPVLAYGSSGIVLGRDEHGITFDHYAYATEAQVKFKEEYYGYTDAVKHWRRLQANTVWPINNLKEFLPWVGDRVVCNRLYK